MESEEAEMLIIPARVVPYFNEVEEWAAANGILDTFSKAMARFHLYGCSWTDIERARFILMSKDFCPHSFNYRVDFRQPDGKYEPFIAGAVIFRGDLREDGKLKLTARESATWEMHS